MELSPFQLLVITGILPHILSSRLRGYHLIRDKMNFNGSWNYCKQNFISLAVVNSPDELKAITAEAQRLGFKSEAWIGMYNDVNSWHWSIDNSELGSVRMWSNGEPNNNNVKEECVKIDGSGKWYDAPCQDPNQFVCYNANGSAQYVHISSPTKSWKDAQAYCRQFYTDLACPKDDTENTAVKAVLSSKSVWMGLFRYSWMWADGTPVSYAAWKSSQPDNSGGTENLCTFLNGGLFHDDVCSDQRAFFCQYSLKKMFVKVQVQSNQDVNDPSVKDGIMQKMQDKLQELGMAEDNTLAWRMQPDGNVFYVKNNKKENSSETCDV
uniref:Macrophage mannose receptor 1-like n=1 Tax=Astyanax mexicanus TaxID=7994 RepID=W5LQP2_ASTMX